MNRTFWLCLLLCGQFFSSFLWAQQNYTVSGYVRDAATGETLLGASVIVEGASNLGTTTNNYGFYSLQLPVGEQELVFSYLGYDTRRVSLNVQSAQRLNVELEEASLKLKEVVVKARPDDANVESTEMGTVGLKMTRVKKIPALMGEVDVLKTIQLLPGVLSAGEGNAGFFVRGGGADQNLVLLDEAVVY
ncbi:MAG TPA: carboxypeptidase-like regulatory domain-containing protein, partial [Phaeodactylibacter sp.]|nr:carboxypeptidase-like regulatory domain-containing protein [Phaeodactylibacter sp.]